MHPLFVLLVVLGFLGQLLGAAGVRNATIVAWALWLAASIIWAIGQV